MRQVVIFSPLESPHKHGIFGMIISTRVAMLSFTEQFDAAVKKITIHAEKVAEAVVVAVGERLVENSPVGATEPWKHGVPADYIGGTFKNSWKHGIGSVNSSTSSSADSTGTESLYEIRTGAAMQPIGVHYISNNELYAWLIERGYIDGPKAGQWHVLADGQSAPVGRTEMEFDGIVREVLVRVSI